VPELVVLGSAGWIPQDRRMTTSLTLRVDDALLLFDAGTGLARLGWDPFRRLLPPENRPIHLFLTHLHLDHTIGLTFLPALWSNPTVVHVPTQEAGGAGPEIFNHIFGGPFFPLAFDDLLPEISLETVGPGEARVEGLRISARRQQHPGGSLSYRVEDAFAFITDAAPDPATADFTRNVRVLVHEAWIGEHDGSDADSTDLKGHSSAEDAARVAKEAEVGELLLCHLPLADEDRHAGMLERARAIFPRTDLCADGMTRQIG
jgi:ribonuclease Z